MLGLGNTISADYKPVFLDDYSLQFNGSDEYIQLSGTVGEIAQETGSVSVWVKGEAVSGSTTIFACSADSSNFIRIWWWNGQTKIAFTVKAGGTSLTATVSDTDFETDDLWHHIGVTWDFGDADEIKLYYDGTLKDTQSGLATWSGTIDAATIAVNSWSAASYHKGKINDFALFDAVVDVSSFYTTPGGIEGKTSDLRTEFDISASLITYYKFEEGVGAIAGDDSPYLNRGTLTNTPTWSTDTP